MSKIDPWVAAAQTIARHCGRSEPDASDYRAVAKAAFHNNDALRAERDEAVALMQAAGKICSSPWLRDRIDDFLAKLGRQP